MFCCFPRKKQTKCSQNLGLVNQFSVAPWGQLNWTGPRGGLTMETLKLGGALRGLEIVTTRGMTATVRKGQDKRHCKGNVKGTTDKLSAPNWCIAIRSQLFAADSAIARISAMGISFVRFNCRENCRALAIFNRKEILTQ